MKNEPVCAIGGSPAHRRPQQARERRTRTNEREKGASEAKSDAAHEAVQIRAGFDFYAGEWYSQIRVFIAGLDREPAVVEP
jgi:hypothetical protein